MKLKTSETYKKEILDLYLKERGGNLSMYLNDPSPSQIREACLLLWENDISKTDKQVLFRFLEVKEPFDKSQLSKFDLDKFKPIRSFLKQETSSPKSPTIEMIAWLIDFDYRPYSNYYKDNPISKRNDSGETVYNHIAGEANRVLKQRAEKPLSNKKTASKQRFLKLLFLILSVIFLLGFLYWKITLPFNTIVNLTKNPNLNLDPDYPIFNKKKDVTLEFHLPTGILKREINSDGEVILIGLRSYLENEPIKVSLNSEHWKLSRDSVELKEGKLELQILPNESLAKIQGEVFAKIGGLPIANAKVKMQDLETLTDSNGLFDLMVPIENRKIEYDLKISKEGYASYSKTYYPGAKIEIGLIKN